MLLWVSITRFAGFVLIKSFLHSQHDNKNQTVASVNEKVILLIHYFPTVAIRVFS